MSIIECLFNQQHSFILQRELKIFTIFITLDTAPKIGWRPRALIGHLIVFRHHDVTAKRLSDMMKNCDTGCLFFLH